MTAVSTWPISRVQVTLGVPSNGGVRKVSSSIATTAVGEAPGELPKARQRSVVRMSIDRPRSGSSAGEAATPATMAAIRSGTSAARQRTMSAPRKS